MKISALSLGVLPGAAAALMCHWHLQQTKRFLLCVLAVLCVAPPSLAASKITGAAIRFQKYPNDYTDYVMTPYEAAQAYMNKAVCRPGAYAINCKVLSATYKIICNGSCYINWFADGEYTWHDPTPGSINPDRGPYSYSNFGGGSNVGCPSGYFLHITSTSLYCWSKDKTPIMEKNKGSCTEGQCCVGNPVMPATGNKFQVETDYHGAGASALILRRYYNSIGNPVISSFGYQWRHEYDRFIDIGGSQSQTSANALDGGSGYIFPAPVAPDPDAASSGIAIAAPAIPSVTVNRPDGKVLYFSLIDGKWSSDADVADQLLQLTDSTGQTTGWQYTNARHDETETYDAHGRLLSITNRAGLAQTLTYDQSARLSSVTDAFGHMLKFAYDAANRISSITDPAGGAYQFDYDGPSGNCTSAFCHNLTAITYPDGSKRVYWYNESNLTSGKNFAHALTGITDENGARYATFAYDATGRAISTEHAGSTQKYSVGYSSNNTQSTVTDPLGTVRTHHYQIFLGMVRSTGQSQPAGAGCAAAASAMTYDANGNVASRTDFNGNKTLYTYDLTRNLETSRTEGAGTAQARTVSTEWHPNWRLPTRIAEPKRITIHTYDAKGNLLTTTIQATTDATGTQGFTATSTGTASTWSATYNEKAQVLTTTDPRGNVTSYSYDNQGNLTTLTNAGGHVTTLANYDANGRVGRLVDPNGLITDLTYHPRGWLTSRTAGGETTRYDYDNAGQLKQVTLPDGTHISYTYDDAHRLTRIADSAGNSIAYTLDAMGNRTREAVKDPGGALARQTTRVYDALNRVRQITGGTQ